eukprot:gene8821-7196_t
MGGLTSARAPASPLHPHPRFFATPPPPYAAAAGPARRGQRAVRACGGGGEGGGVGAGMYCSLCGLPGFEGVQAVRDHMMQHADYRAAYYGLAPAPPQRY